MIRLECDSGAVEHHLRSLVDLVEKQGGFLNKRLVIRCQEGNFSLCSKDSSLAGKWIVRLPPSCLLPLKQFELSVSGDAFHVASHASEFSGRRLELLEVFLALLNETGKAASLKATDPGMVQVDDPELHARLAEGRVQGSGQARKGQDPGGRNPEKLLLLALNKTRALVVGKGDSQATPENGLVFMPVIDFVNHHCLAPGFDHQVEPGGHQRLSLQGFFPFPNTMECFAKYSDYDAYDLYLNYGYVERNTIFARSVPVVISLPDLGTIKVRASVATVTHPNLPPRMAHLAPYLPAIAVDHDARVAEVSFLLIPRQTTLPMALREVLDIVFSYLDPSLALTKRMQYLEMAEGQLLSENVKYYKALRDYLDNLELARRDRYGSQIKGATEMIQVQLSLLANYLISLHNLKRSIVTN